MLLISLSLLCLCRKRPNFICTKKDAILVFMLIFHIRSFWKASSSIGLVLVYCGYKLAFYGEVLQVIYILCSWLQWDPCAHICNICTYIMEGMFHPLQKVNVAFGPKYSLIRALKNEVYVFSLLLLDYSWIQETLGLFLRWEVVSVNREGI